MRFSKLAGLSLKSLKHTRAAAVVMGTAAAVFCICFAGSALVSVRREKALPYELVVERRTDGTMLTDDDIFKISRIPGVSEATPVVHFPVRVEVGAFRADLTLTGIHAAYLPTDFSKGTVFPEDTVMPYLVLNGAALRQFTEADSPDGGISKSLMESGNGASETLTEGGAYETDKTDADKTGIDWLGASFSVRTGEESRPVISRVCGILKENSEDNPAGIQLGEEQEWDQEPTAYVSLSAAKMLAEEAERSANTGYEKAFVRAADAGQAQGISKALAGLGLSVTNPNRESQMKWDVLTKEMVYLFLLGMVFLAFSMVLTALGRKARMLEQKQVWTTLLWMGFSDRILHGMFRMQNFILTAAGSVLGVIVAISLPAFLTAGVVGETLFTMPIPMEGILVAVALCLAAGQASAGWFVGKRVMNP